MLLSILFPFSLVDGFFALDVLSIHVKRETIFHLWTLLSGRFALCGLRGFC